MATKGDEKSRVGIAVDAFGNSTIDPTKNVLDLVSAMALRQDDLRIEIVKRIDAELKHIQSMARLRADHAKELGVKESDRLDKIRQVDVMAVGTADTRSQAAIQALAATTALNAETLRTAVAASAQALAKQFTDTVGALTERISALEKSSYEGKGRQTLAEPQLAELTDLVRKLSTTGDRTTGKQEGISASWALLIAVVGLVMAAITIGSFVYALNGNSDAPQAVVSVPAGASHTTPSKP